LSQSSQKSMVPQTTLKHRIACNGVGVHSGVAVAMTLLPAAADSGIVFRRVDLPGQPEIPARWDNATDLMLCTSLMGEAGAKIGTVEHLLAAFAGLGVDNAVVEIDGPEVPVMDGSSAPFVFLIECAGVTDLPAPRRYIEVLRPVEVREGNKIARLLPAAQASIAVTIDYAIPTIGRQSVSVTLGEGAFKAELARARTFGLLHEVDMMRARGLALGGSLDNAVVVSDEGVLNEGGLRFADEFVRHKALDAVGDMFLAGAPLLAAFEGERSGHALNNRLLRALFAEAGAWQIVTRARRAAPRQMAEAALAVA
jgi:UDP-3-O-[3-hydroxymyristoyl] N-acetylglucosamine deacetylase